MTLGLLALFPARVGWTLLGVAVLGVVVLVAAYRLRKETLLRDILRDIGIAFIVAAVVSAIYEYSTRSVEEHETALAAINRMMSAFVPDPVWNEVKGQVLHRNALRRNVQIEIKLTRNATARNGAVVAMPAGKAVLWMRYSYDLEGLSAADTTLSIQHELDYFMHDEALDLPRFERVLIVGPNADIQRVYEGASLQRIYDGKGLIRLEGADSVKVPPIGSGKRVRVVTERYEIVNIPGYYYLVMRELTAHDETTNEPTVRVLISELPRDVQATLTTYYPAHSFTTPDATKSVWTLDGTLLPGQGLTVTLTPRPPGR